MSEKGEPPEKPEKLQESAWALFRKSAELRKQSNDLALRAHDLLEQAKKLKDTKGGNEGKKPKS